MILTSTRLILRHFQEGDEQALFDLLSDKAVSYTHLVALCRVYSS